MEPYTVVPPIDVAFETFKSRQDEFLKFSDIALSETDTRSKVIDPILAILGWQEQNIVREWHERTEGKFLDYKLSTTYPVFVVEAKKNFLHFEIPPGNARHYRISGVIDKSPVLKEAIAQARGYALNSGISFCCATNGFQFVFFRATNTTGIPWDRHLVTVFRSHSDILDRFKDFYETLSFESVLAGRFSSNILVDHLPANESSRFHSLRDELNLQHQVRDRNVLFPYTRELIKRVFQSLDNDEASPTLLEHCYVESSRDSSYERGIGELLKEHRTKIPGAVKIQTQKKDAGDFQNQLENLAKTEPEYGSVTLILGTVGAGKTSFLNRFRKVYAPAIIEQNYIWVQISFNSFVESTDNLSSWIGEKIHETLEEHYGNLNPLSWDSLKEVYSKEISSLQKGILKPLYDQDPQQYDLKISEQISEFSKNKETHYLRCLSHFAKKYHRQIILVFDNADQHTPKLQNEVFLIAQKHSSSLKCVALISLREESYWRNKEFGALSAFHPTAFQITAPRIEQVLSKRFKYASRLILESNAIVAAYFATDTLNLTPEKIDKLFKILHSTLLGDDKRFIRFLEYMAPGEVRLSLDFVARFLTSGHTNINRLLDVLESCRIPPIGFHEFLQAVMLGDRMHFSELLSDVINLFRVEGKGDQSHFNRLAVLARVLNASGEVSELGIGYVPVRTICESCDEIGMSNETTQAVVGALVRKRLLATETLARDSATNIASVRATTAALYYTRELGFTFTYLDLILIDTEIGNMLVRQELSDLSKAILDEPDRYKKIELRVKRYGIFVKYLKSEYDASSLATAGTSFESDARRLIQRIVDTQEMQSAEILVNAQQAFRK